MSNNCMIEINKKIIQSSMEKIVMDVKLKLISYVQRQYELRLASAIAILGVDSPETIEALKDTNEKVKNRIIFHAKRMIEDNHILTNEVDSILECWEKNLNDEHKKYLDNEYKSIKEHLYFVGSDEAKKLIDNFRKELPVLQNKLNDCILNFNDIQYLDDRSVQILLKELDQQQLAKALKGASTGVQKTIFCNMPKTTATMLKEDLEYMGPLSLKEVEEAQTFIIKTLISLESKGKVEISSLRPSDLIK